MGGALGVFDSPPDQLCPELTEEREKKTNEQTAKTIKHVHVHTASEQVT